MAPRASPTHAGGSPPLHSAVVIQFESMPVPFSVLLFCLVLRLRTFVTSLVASCASMRARV